MVNLTIFLLIFLFIPGCSIGMTAPVGSIAVLAWFFTMPIARRPSLQNIFYLFMVVIVMLVLAFAMRIVLFDWLLYFYTGGILISYIVYLTSWLDRRQVKEGRRDNAFDTLWSVFLTAYTIAGCLSYFITIGLTIYVQALSSFFEAIVGIGTLLFLAIWPVFTVLALIYPALFNGRRPLAVY